MIEEYEYVRRRIKKNVGIAKSNHALLAESRSTERGCRGAIIGYLTECATADHHRHNVLNWLFGKFTTKLLTDEEWYALDLWVDSHWDNEDQHWVPSPTFCDECFNIAVALWREQERPK